MGPEREQLEDAAKQMTTGMGVPQPRLLDAGAGRSEQEEEARKEAEGRGGAAGRDR